MTIKYLKKAIKTPSTDDHETRTAVQNILDDIEKRILISHKNNESLEIKSVDKFPCLTDYIIPPGVRIGDASRVRLGAYLSEGTTVMHEGFVNFNAGTLGPAMIEGRISAGVVVGKNSDLGGGCSTMGTLSGGNEVKISIGENCLLGANSGLGIPLGDNCTIEAGLYITGGSKLQLIILKMSLDQLSKLQNFQDVIICYLLGILKVVLLKQKLILNR